MRKIRRLLAFFAKRIVAAVMIALLLVSSFYIAMNTAGIWVIVDEGMEARARAVICGDDPQQLTRYFTEDFIRQDPVLQIGLGEASPYRDYSVRSITHRVHFHSIWAWPWEIIGRAEITEEVPSIDGSILPSLRETVIAAGGQDRLKPPAWNSARFRVTLLRNRGRWVISSLQQLAEP
ncbi:MAG: hypothetical protein K5746_06850 [Clostridiales bacterium]|nr:hypothetical protein [Clostridiales bacterium]